MKFLAFAWDRSDTLALIGALSGLVALFAQVWQFALSGYRVKAVVTYGYLPPEMFPLICVEVQNRGRMPITVQGVSLEPGTNKVHAPIHLFGGYTQGASLPHRIESHDAASWAVDRRGCEVAISEQGGERWVRARISLATGKTVLSSRKRL